MHHSIEELHVIIIIPCRHQAHCMKVRSEDEGILVDRSILNNCFAIPPDVHYLIQPTVEKVNLKIKGPTLHVLIEIIQVRIVFCILKVRFPFVMLGKQLGERSLSSPYVSRYRNMHVPRFYFYCHKYFPYFMIALKVEINLQKQIVPSSFL